MGQEVKRIIGLIVSGISSFLWFLILRKSQADNLIYFFCALISLIPPVLHLINQESFLCKLNRKGVVVLAGVFSFLITLSNFDLWTETSITIDVVKGTLLFLSTIVVFKNLLSILYNIYILHFHIKNFSIPQRRNFLRL